MKLLAVCLSVGAVIGAIPATIMEFLEPESPGADPAVLGAFVMPMLAGMMGGFCVWIIADHIRYWRNQKLDYDHAWMKQ
jgi:hypothetical protein